MKSFVRLIGTNNIVELDQIKFALNRAKIEVQTQNETALLLGNVEVTGISGASILVPENRLEDAQNVLIEMGLDSTDKSESDNRWIIYSAAAILISMLLVALLFA